MSKRSPTAYNFVSKDKELKQKLRLENPTWNQSEFMAEFGRLWKSWAPEDRQRYVDQAAEAKKTFSPSDDIENTISQNSVILKPKRACSSYFQFLAVRRAILKQSDQLLSQPEITKILSSEWGSLSAEEKLPYEKLHLEEKEELLNNPIMKECKVKIKSKNITNPVNNEKIQNLEKIIDELKKDVLDLKTTIHNCVKIKLQNLTPSSKTGTSLAINQVSEVIS